jgi:hypothetical protein
MALSLDVSTKIPVVKLDRKTISDSGNIWGGVRYGNSLVSVGPHCFDFSNVELIIELSSAFFDERVRAESPLVAEQFGFDLVGHPPRLVIATDYFTAHGVNSGITPPPLACLERMLIDDNTVSVRFRFESARAMNQIFQASNADSYSALIDAVSSQYSTLRREAVCAPTLQKPVLEALFASLTKPGVITPPPNIMSRVFGDQILNVFAPKKNEIVAKYRRR